MRVDKHGNVQWRNTRTKSTAIFRANNGAAGIKFDDVGDARCIWSVAFVNGQSTGYFKPKYMDPNTGEFVAKGRFPHLVWKRLNMFIEEQIDAGYADQKAILKTFNLGRKLKPPQWFIDALADLSITSDDDVKLIFNEMKKSGAFKRAIAAAMFCLQHRGERVNGMDLGSKNTWDKFIGMYENRRGGKISSELHRSTLDTLSKLVATYTTDATVKSWLQMKTSSSGKTQVVAGIDRHLRKKVQKVIDRFATECWRRFSESHHNHPTFLDASRTSHAGLLRFLNEES